MPEDQAHSRFEDALLAFADLAVDSGARWVLGGSAGLALRGARLASAPRDLDIYADAESVLSLHDRLKPFACDGPVWDESGSYRSLLAHYGVAGISIELVGDFEVNARGSRYITEVDTFLYENGDVWTSGSGNGLKSGAETKFGSGSESESGSEPRSDKPGRTIRLVPLGHELIFNVLRERPDRAREAARLILENPGAHMPVLERLIARQSLSEEALEELRRLTAGGASGLEGDGQHG